MCPPLEKSEVMAKPISRKKSNFLFPVIVNAYSKDLIFSSST